MKAPSTQSQYSLSQYWLKTVSEVEGSRRTFGIDLSVTTKQCSNALIDVGKYRKIFYGDGE